MYRQWEEKKNHGKGLLLTWVVGSEKVRSIWSFKITKHVNNSFNKAQAHDLEQLNRCLYFIQTSLKPVSAFKVSTKHPSIKS